MNTETTEQGLRREAIRRRVAGEQRGDICRDLGRSTRWLDKWWAVYQHDPTSDLADRSRAPHTSPQRVPAEVITAVVGIRKTLEAAKTPATRYSPIGPRAIAGQLDGLGSSTCPVCPASSASCRPRA